MEGTMKLGDFKSLRDQTLEIMTMLDKVLEKYVEFMNGQGLFEIADEDPVAKAAIDMFNETLVLVKNCEVVAINWADTVEKMDRKVDKILTKFDA